MIIGFEPQTHDLTPDELKMAGIIAKVIVNNVGKDNRCTSDRIITKMRDKYGFNMNGARVRKVLNYLRTTGRVKLLVADSKGYWIAQNKDEVEKYLTGLHQRIESQVGLYNAIHKQLQDMNTQSTTQSG